MQWQMTVVFLVGCIIGNIFSMENHVKKPHRRLRSLSGNDSIYVSHLEWVNARLAWGDDEGEDYGYTYLHYAMTRKNFSLNKLQFLMEYGARLNVKADDDEDLHTMSFKCKGRSPMTNRLAKRKDVHNPKVAQFIHGELVKNSLEKEIVFRKSVR